MAKWVLKAIVQKILSKLPYKHQLNFFFQYHITRGARFNDIYFEDKIIHASNHYDNFCKFSNKTTNFSVLELGTGWYPVVPLCYFLFGADKIVTVDLTQHISARSIRTVLNRFEEYADFGKLDKLLPKFNMSRLEYLLNTARDKYNLSFKELLKEFRIEYQCGDLRKMKLVPSKFDLISSNNTFEHIYPQILSDILKIFKSLSNEDTIWSHFIDMSDHFAHLDSSINIYNFLQYSEKKWAQIDNSIQPQNRLRITDYKLMYEELGIKILEEISRVGHMELLNQIQINPMFSKINKSDMAVSHTYLISRIK